MVLIVFVKVDDGVTGLLDVDGSRERDGLAGISFCTDAVLLIRDVACCDWRVVRDLLTDELGALEISEEKLAEECVQRLFHTGTLVAAGVLLAF